MSFLSAQPNFKILNVLFALSFISAFIYMIASFVVASKSCIIESGCEGGGFLSLLGTSAGEGFMIVMFGLYWAAVIGATGYFFNKKMSQEVVSYSIAMTSNIILTSLIMAVWAGAQVTSLRNATELTITVEYDQGYYHSLKAMTAGASLLLIFQSALLVVLNLWKTSFGSTEQDSNINYDGTAAAYQPSSSYQNFDPQVDAGYQA